MLIIPYFYDYFFFPVMVFLSIIDIMKTGNLDC